MQVAYICVPKTCAKRIQSAFNAPVRRVELIRTETRRASSKYFIMFKKNEPKRAPTFSNVCEATRTGRTPN